MVEILYFLLNFIDLLLCVDGFSDLESFIFTFPVIIVIFQHFLRRGRTFKGRNNESILLAFAAMHPENELVMMVNKSSDQKQGPESLPNELFLLACCFSQSANCFWQNRVR